MVIGRRSTVQHCATPTGTQAPLGGMLESFLAGPGVTKRLDQRIRNRTPWTHQHARSRRVVVRAPVAQWIEHLTTDQKVRGSSPFGRTT